MRTPKKLGWRVLIIWECQTRDEKRLASPFLSRICERSFEEIGRLNEINSVGGGSEERGRDSSRVRQVKTRGNDIKSCLRGIGGGRELLRQPSERRALSLRGSSPNLGQQGDP